MERNKIFILTLIPAPYRVELFEELGKIFDLTVCFERDFDDNRNKDWFQTQYKNIKGEMLDNHRFDIGIINKIKNRDYDLVILYEYSTLTAMLLMSYCIAKRIPYFINVDGGPYSNPSLIKEAIKKYFIVHASGCLANGNKAKEYCLKYGAELSNIYNHYFTSLYSEDILEKPIPLEEKDKMKADLGLPIKKTAISVGRFIKLKQFDLLIKLWAELPRDYELMIIGGGEEKANYEKLISQYGLSNVKLIDYLPKNVLLKYYKASDMLIHPTSIDVWGLIINEAMAVGLPIVSTTGCTAAREMIVDGENGYVSVISNNFDMIRKIKAILSDPQLSIKMANNNIKKILPYTYENNAKVQERIFMEFFSNGKLKANETKRQLFR